LRGEIAEARPHLDQALALYDPAEQRSLATRFGEDQTVATLSMRPWVLWLLGYPEAALRARGVEVAVFKAGASEQIAPMMDEAKTWGATALNVLSTPLFSFNRRIVIEGAAALALPAIYEWPEMAEEGGLIGCGARLLLLYRQEARLLVKVLGGVKPEDIPVEEPAKFDLVVNLKTAKALGLTIPESFLIRADEVIE